MLEFRLLRALQTLNRSVRIFLLNKISRKTVQKKRFCKKKSVSFYLFLRLNFYYELIRKVLTGKGVI